MSAPAFFHIQAYAVPAGSSKSSTDSSSVGTVAQRRERSITAAAATASRTTRKSRYADTVEFFLRRSAIIVSLSSCRKISCSRVEASTEIRCWS